jgi:hypothetical protein
MLIGGSFGPAGQNAIVRAAFNASLQQSVMCRLLASV